MSASQGDYLASLPLVTIPASELLSEHAHDLWDKIRADAVRVYVLGRGDEASQIIEHLGEMRVRVKPDIWAQETIKLLPDELVAVIDYTDFCQRSKDELIRGLVGYYIATRGQG